jgi:hypothetical protein
MEELKSEIQAVMCLKDQLQKENEPLLGLEHLIYLRDEKFNPFICTLCSKSDDYFNIIQHFNSAIHKMKFLVSMKPRIELMTSPYRLFAHPFAAPIFSVSA